MSDSVCPKCAAQLASGETCEKCVAEGATPGQEKDLGSERQVASLNAVSRNIDLGREHTATAALPKSSPLSGRPGTSPSINSARSPSGPPRSQPQKTPLPAPATPGWRPTTPAWVKEKMEPLKRMGTGQEPAWFHRHSVPTPSVKSPSGAPEVTSSVAAKTTSKSSTQMLEELSAKRTTKPFGEPSPPETKASQDVNVALESVSDVPASSGKNAEEAKQDKREAIQQAFRAAETKTAEQAAESVASAESVEVVKTAESVEASEVVAQVTKEPVVEASSQGKLPVHAVQTTSEKEESAPQDRSAMSSAAVEEAPAQHTPEKVERAPEANATNSQPVCVAPNAPVAPVRSPVTKRRIVTEVHVAPAGIISRNIARLMDLVCLGAVVALVILMAESVTGLSLMSLAALKAFAPHLAGLFCLLAFAYFTLFHALGGRTPGKWVVGIYVLDDRGKPPSLGRSTARTLLAFVSGAIAFLGFFAALVFKDRQTLHDKVTDTHVVWLIRIS